MKRAFNITWIYLSRYVLTLEQHSLALTLGSVIHQSQFHGEGVCQHTNSLSWFNTRVPQESQWIPKKALFGVKFGLAASSVGIFFFLRMAPIRLSQLRVRAIRLMTANFFGSNKMKWTCGFNRTSASAILNIIHFYVTPSGDLDKYPLGSCDLSSM